MSIFTISQSQYDAFWRDGYLLVPRLFDAEEMDLLLNIGKSDHALGSEARGRRDKDGGVSKLSLRNHLSENDIYSAFVQSRRIVDNMERLFRGEVYHFHHKMMIKEPHVGGAWEWHQDYGYWYKFNYCLLPDMASCMIAVDRAHKGNGCLQVIKGSHLMGRVEHGVTGDQTGADMTRVEAALQRMPLVHVEMEPGTALFFHANLLHRSDANKSADPRWSFICCYNTARNNPFKDLGPGGHPSYHYLERLDDESRVKEIGRAQLAAIRRDARAPQPV